MPRKPKTPLEQTNDEALRKLFPRKVVNVVKKTAEKSVKKSTKDQSK